jgi:hypothetical protein
MTNGQTAYIYMLSATLHFHTQRIQYWSRLFNSGDYAENDKAHFQLMCEEHLVQQFIIEKRLACFRAKSVQHTELRVSEAGQK